MNPAHTRRKGSTLIEILIYSLLLALFISAAFIFLGGVLSSSNTATERNEVVAGKEFIERKFAWVFGRSGGILSPALGYPAPSLWVSGDDANVYPASFTVSGEELYLSMRDTGGEGLLGEKFPLTNDRVKVIGFTAARFPSSQSAGFLRVNVTLQSAIYPTIVATSTRFYSIR